jgi:hypothetical protein
VDNRLKLLVRLHPSRIGVKCGMLQRARELSRRLLEIPWADDVVAVKDRSHLVIMKRTVARVQEGSQVSLNEGYPGARLD